MNARKHDTPLKIKTTTRWQKPPNICHDKRKQHNPKPAQLNKLQASNSKLTKIYHSLGEAITTKARTKTIYSKQLVPPRE
jgi:hypothetical protein